MSVHNFECSEDGQIVTHSIDAVRCEDVVRAMYYYLLGCSFAKESILESMAMIVEEYEEKDDE